MSLADISIAPLIERMEANRLSRLVDWDTRPAVGRWWTQMQSTPAYQMVYSFKDPSDNPG